MMPKTRAEAKAIGSKFYFTGSRCKNGHFADRRTLSGHCTECESIALRSDKWRKYRREHFQRTRETVLAQSKVYYETNRDQVLNRTSKWAKANRPKCNAATKRWTKRYPEKHQAKMAMYRTRKIDAMPSWVNKSEIIDV